MYELTDTLRGMALLLKLTYFGYVVGGIVVLALLDRWGSWRSGVQDD